MDIIKRNGQHAAYEREKITRVINLAFSGIGTGILPMEAEQLTDDIEARLFELGENTAGLPVETIQDCVEIALMERGHYDAMKSFILYRSGRTRARMAREQLMQFFGTDAELDARLKEIQKEFDDDSYGLAHLARKFATFYKPGMERAEALALLKRRRRS